MPEADFWKLIVAIIIGLLGSTAYAWAREYFSTRAHVIATQHEITEIQKQLRENTEITRAVDEKFSRSDVLWRGEWAFRQQQLAELYCPIYSILKTNEQIFWMWMEGKLNDKNFDVRQLFHIHAPRIRELIITKAQLIEGTNMPEPFAKFCISSLIFDLYVVPKNEDEVLRELPSHLKDDPRCAYPFDFNEHIFRVTEALKARIASLYAEHAPPLKVPSRSVN